jgi:UDP-N-acetylglucosamine--N-acetylmuramyl-(pentapeptide) pyrophosphoryl-undecaprenol N-acetylglucosamine transferase
VIHISGLLDEGATQARRERLSDEQKSHYKLFTYLHSEEMGLALAAADLVISRAGASTLGEYPLMGLPAILVPYPFAWRYQKVNADYLVEKGAAVRLDNDKLSDELLPTLASLLDDEAHLDAMKQCARSLARPQAASDQAAQLREMAGA